MPLRTGTFALLQAARGHAVHDDGHYHDEATPDEEQAGVALGLPDVVENHAEHQCDAHSDGEGDRHACQRHAGGEQDVGGIEDDASDEGTEHRRARHLLQVGDEAAAFLARAAQREADEQGEEQDADDVVPVEQFIAPTLGGKLLCVAPRAPANHRDHTEHDGQQITVYDKHKWLYFLVLN